MKRYLLFSYEMHESSGGWQDFTCDFDTVKQAQNSHTPRVLGHDRCHIVDTTTMKIVSELSTLAGKPVWHDVKFAKKFNKGL